MALLWVDLFGIYFAVKSGLISAVEVGDEPVIGGHFFVALGVIEEIKSPVGAGAH